MIYPGFIGSLGPSQSALASERLVNWYLERSPLAIEGAILLPTPGQENFVTVGHIGARALFAVNGRFWGVVATGFYEFFANGTAILRGSVVDNNYPATISYNPRATGTELWITSGGNGYTHNITTNAEPSLVLTNEATQGGMVNNRYLAFNLMTGVVKISNLNGATFSQSFSRSKSSDPWQAMLVGPSEIWMLGEYSGEVWYDTGAVPQPFAPIPGAEFKTGIAAPFAGTVFGEQVVWMSKTEFGSGRIVVARGYTPQPISTPAVETAISAYARINSLATTEVLSYEQDGHPFVVFSFPLARASWAVDLDLGTWHERGTWNINQTRYDEWHPRVHAYAFNKHFVGGRTSGQISELDVTFGAEADGGPIRRLRIGPPLWAKSGQRLRVSRFDLMLDTGLGLATGQGADPMVMFRSSRNGRTWSSERQASAGRMGDYDHQVFFTRCGSSEKIWMPEVVVSDPTPWRIVGANVEGDGFLQRSRAA